jgi:hypothetical protein
VVQTTMSNCRFHVAGVNAGSAGSARADTPRAPYNSPHMLLNAMQTNAVADANRTVPMTTLSIFFPF